ncbi:MAG: hypothetical protein E7050_07950 [Lentisphaerae bacterium]|nr:hypothetical protein [Lentisphaerota bacterium]
MKKIFFRLTAILLFLSASVFADGIEDMQGLNLQNIKIPFYKDEKLQMLIFADSGRRKERLMVSDDTFLDILLESADVDKIPDGWRTKLYPLGADLTDILKFWGKRYRISDAVIFTSQCAIDQKDEMVSGDRPIFLRTPMFDLDGTGFKVDFRRQIIEIKSDVNIILRSSDMDPRRILTGTPIPREKRIVTATSNELRLDRKSNKIILIGNVKVVDGRNTLTCDRLTVFTDPEEKNKTSLNSNDEKAVLNGVSRVLADGNVILTQYPEDPAKIATEMQASQSDHLEYDAKRGIIILTGDNNDPTLTRGSDTELRGKRIELLRHEDRMFVMKDCRITSLVRDSRGILLYARRINSDRANFDGKNNIANFHGNVVAVDQTSTLTTDSLRVHLVQDEKTSSHKLNLIFANGNVKIVSRSEKDVPGNPGKKVVSHSTIASRQAELNFRNNKIVFYKDVKVRDESAALDCDRLDLFMTDRPDDKATEISGAPMAAGMEGRNKSINRMVAKDNVTMISGSDELKTDMLTFFFRDLPPGEKPSPGMIQSGGVQLVKIKCDGSVQASSQTEQDGVKITRVLKSTNAMSDLIKDYSEFHGDVTVIDGNTEIHCRDMYIFTGASPINEVIEENTPQTEEKDEFDDEDLDADPFALDMGENSVPSRIAISDNRDLKRIVCQKQVVLLRRDKKGRIQRAGGDRAVYTVNTREVVLTAERPNRPWLRSEGRKQFCDIIRSDLATEDLRGIGNVVVMPDNQK